MADLPGFLVDNAVGTNRKLRRLSVPERWCALAGVWAIASMSPVRGYLLISDGIEATAEDFADQSGVTPAVARSCLRKLRDLGMLERDEEIGAEHVHDWHKHQPEASKKPSDSREAWRERKRRQRAASREGHADVPRDEEAGHAMSRGGIEEKRKEGTTTPPTPASGGARTPGLAPVPDPSSSMPSFDPPPLVPTGRRSRDKSEHDAAVAAWRAAWQRWLALPPGADAQNAAVAVADVLAAGVSPSVLGQIGQVHAHRSDGGPLLLGLAGSGYGLDYVERSFGRMISQALGSRRWRLVECRCPSAAREAA